ncbi:hypothetical protein AB6A40_000421 [Gnathostoma spinigerum]|uniref:Cell cycle checkpoint control protein n=1 Tax=Gnathostoma spinigerum TaxID=75299 RepID=A0ABD6EAK7_9BILA
MPLESGNVVNDGRDVADGACFTVQGCYKIFARAVLTLNRIGEELYLEPNSAGLILRSINCTKSAYGTFLFCPTFFTVCDVDRINNSDFNLCRISMRCALAAFKCSKSVDKTVLSCKMYINPKADSMLVQLTQTYDVIKSHKIPFLECSTSIRNVVDKNNLKNVIIAPPQLLSHLFLQMPHNVEELILSAKSDSFVLRNFVTKDQDDDKLMKTEAKVNISEFDRYCISQESSLSIAPKELKAFVGFAEMCQDPVSLYFDFTGSVMVVALESEINYTAELSIATLNMDGFLTGPTQYEGRQTTSSVTDEISKNVQSEMIETTSKSCAENRFPNGRKSPCLSAPLPRISGVNNSELNHYSELGKNHMDVNEIRLQQDCSALQVNSRCRLDGGSSTQNPKPNVESESSLEDQGFRRFFLASSQRMLHASQLFSDRVVLAPDSDSED